jgi:two-component system sensor histidine kinase KdpD
MSAMDEPPRPEPEALLAEAAREGRGRLKVYLGMAPGVGKTYEMLAHARRLKEQGVDVVAGIVETHGRAETQALLNGLEVLPRLVTTYRGHELRDFDLNAALARRPSVLLVDELAHTNPPESRHPKRWQDVEELLRAGIDVHTTVNIQHLESLNDVVARITGIRIRETLPDRVLEQADEVELIDLTPEELIGRLREGKVYVPDLAGRARDNFFKPGNLTALRELALRQTAERVDAQMVGYMRRHAIEGPWPAGERLMVCVGNDQLGPYVVREGRRLAETMKAPWVAAHVERPGSVTTPAAEKATEDAMALAERLRARTERLAGADLPGEILSYAKRNNITQIVIGRSRAGWLREALRRSLAQALVRRSEGIAIHIVTPPAAASAGWIGKELTLPGLPAAATAVVGIAAVVGLTFAVEDLRAQSNVALLFLAVVLWSAVGYGLVAALATAILAFLAYNFFFTEPYHTLWVAHWHDIVALLVFLIVAATTGILAGRVRDQMQGARSRIVALQMLYDFARRLGAAKTSDELLHAVVLQAHRLSGRPAVVLLPSNDDIAIRYAWPPEDRLDESALAAARWTLRHAEPAGAHTGTLPSANWHFRPLRTANGAVGVLGVGAEHSPLPHDLAQTLDAMLDQTAVAVERIDFSIEVSRAEAMAETEKFRGALLSSVSHDLRTPLTSILGSITALRRDPSRYDAKAREELLATIEEEAERLDRIVNNLLDVTRLEGGALEVKREWIAVSEVVDSAARRFAGKLGAKRLIRKIAPDVPLLRGDFTLLETTLFNLIDNALKHAVNAAVIEVGASSRGADLLITVTDDGDGIAREHLPRLFDKFYRIRKTDQTPAGTGLGLSICKGLVEAMGGRIDVESPTAAGRGTRFALRFPVEPQPAAAALREAEA